MGYKFVKSKYASPWIGIVLNEQPRVKYKSLFTILIIEDKSGNTPRKRIIKTLDEAWTEEVDNFDISHINKDWFKLNK